MMPAQRKLSAPAFVLGGLWFLYVAGSTTTGRLLTEVDGVILARQMTTGPRYATTYTVRTPGGKTHAYVAGATDESLSREFPIGSHVIKRKWQLGYSLDGRWIQDFSIPVYGLVFAAGVCMLWFGIVVAIQQRRKRADPGAPDGRSP